MTRLALSVFFGLSLLGASCDSDPCSLKDGSLTNSYHPTGSQTLAASSDRQFVLATNATENSVSLLRASDLSRLDRLEIGATPERVAPLGNQFVVSLRGERALAKVAVINNKITITDRIDTGAEPIGLVTSEDASKVYVAVSQSGLIEERSGETLELVRSLKIDHEPRWLALHPGGQTLYVASAMGGHLIVVDLIDGSTEEQSLPNISVPVINEDFRPVDRTRRITGDLTVRPNGRQLLVPVLYIDNINPIDGDPNAEEPSGDGYGNSGSGKRFIAAVATIDVDAKGQPTGQGKVEELEANMDGETLRGGYATSITVHPTRDVAFATMEASDTLIAFAIAPTETQCSYGSPGTGQGVDLSVGGGGGLARRIPAPDHVHTGDFARSALQKGFGTLRGPVGVAFVGDDAIVHNRIDRTAQSVPAEDMSPLDHNDSDHGVGNWNHKRATKTVSLESALLDADTQRGLGLFFSNTDAEVSGHNINVSCSSCHFDGRNDGLTWQFADGPRQTPSLAGNVSLTEPVTWRDEVATVADEVRLTSQGRMGGSGLLQANELAVTDYVNWRPHVDLPNKGIDNAIIAEGREIFFSASAACGSCHTGEQYTDTEMHRIRGVDVRTPTLIGIAASAPYFHDGSAESLRELLERSRDGKMGNTRDLTDAQLEALEAFLTTL